MSRKAGLLAILTAGLVWGLVEIYVGDVFYKFNLPFRSATLTAIGMGLLVVARKVYDRPGSSLAAGVIAGILRCAVPKVYICHMVAIAIEGCAFDATWTAVKASERQTLRRAYLAGAIAVYSGLLAFGMAGIYLFKFGKWVAGGLGGAGLYALKSGSVAFAIFIVLAPIALRAASSLAVRIPGAAEGSAVRRKT
jgi:thiamine transporter ThiT